MRNFVQFLFSGNDVQKIDISSIQVDDVLPIAAPPAGSLAPSSMRLRFRQNDPGPAQIRPLLPGSIRFIVDPAAAGVLPNAAAVDFTSGAYGGWKTLGRLLIMVTDKAVADEIPKLAPDLPVKPNMIWYGPIRIPPGFLFDTLLNLKHGDILSDGRTIRPKKPNGTINPEWHKYAVAEFLAGRYAPTLQRGADATQDDAVRFVMPIVEVPTGGVIELFVTTALAQKPQDGPDADFDDPANPISRDEPLHPRNGLIPAREVYRQLRASMVEEAPAEPLRDAILADWPDAPRFFAISFTRTWERIPNCSAHFTRHNVRIEEGPNTLMEQRLPAHGVVFLRQAPASPQPAPPNVVVSIIGGDMKWLLGGGTSWRDKGRTDPVPINLATVAKPHIAVRLPMTKAIFSDTTRPAPGGMSCTFLSIRRTVIRALIDNRIAGGRLNFGLNSTSAVTRGIIQRAFANTAATVILVADNAADPFGDPDLALTFRPILSAFFPGDAPQQPIPGRPANAKTMTQGEMAYFLWQSIATDPVNHFNGFQEEPTKRNFSQEHIGGGGPGAIVALGLGQFHNGVGTVVIDSEAALDQRVGLILAGLQPGATLQFWKLAQDFLDIQQRNAPAASPGHSPVFVRYDGPENAPTGIVIIDQFDETVCPVVGAPGHRRIDWSPNRPWVAGTGWMPELWIAANWDE